MTVRYFDHAAATPLDADVLAAMQPYFSEQFYNPSATYTAGQSARKSLEAARTQVAAVLAARASEIIFTAGGTEANNLAIHGIMQRFPEGNIVVSSIEHDSVLAPAHHYDCREVAVMADGRIDLEDLKAKIDDNTVLVSIMYANNEVGTLQPLRDVGQLIQGLRKGRARPLYFHTDACQAANYLDLQASRLGVDLMTLNGGKIYGPKQSGVLFVRGGLVLEPLILGGGQERGLRSGTENVAGAVGFAAALTKTHSLRREEAQRLEGLQEQFVDLLTEKIPQAVLNGSRKSRLANNVHITLPGFDNERLLIQLDEAGFLAAAGSACSASNEEPSHVLRAMGLSDQAAQASLRFTMGRATTEEQVRQVVDTLSSLVAQ
ncbi:MAG: Aminotransferase [Candidatus Saccharibacteria bacterium]|nr:Aminotransferase [Candidatus Saccharibacteria bacterium]